MFQVQPNTPKHHCRRMHQWTGDGNECSTHNASLTHKHLITHMHDIPANHPGFSRIIPYNTLQLILIFVLVLLGAIPTSRLAGMHMLYTTTPYLMLSSDSHAYPKREKTKCSYPLKNQDFFNLLYDLHIPLLIPRL